jgi:hypothetical protein
MDKKPITVSDAGKKGGTKTMTIIINNDVNIHSFRLDTFAVNTGDINGTALQSNATLRMSTVSFIANQTGVFQWRCGVPPTAPGRCDPTH